MSNRILDLKISEVKWFPVLTTSSFREQIIRLVVGGLLGVRKVGSMLKPSKR